MYSYSLLCLIITVILGYFMPTWVSNLSWKELINGVKGIYSNDAASTLQILDKVKNKIAPNQELSNFFEENLIISIVLTAAILIGTSMLVSIIIKHIEKKEDEIPEDETSED